MSGGVCGRGRGGMGTRGEAGGGGLVAPSFGTD